MQWLDKNDGVKTKQTNDDGAVEGDWEDSHLPIRSCILAGNVI
jgi:hypothetical protein